VRGSLVGIWIFRILALVSLLAAAFFSFRLARGFALTSPFAGPGGFSPTDGQPATAPASPGVGETPGVQATNSPDVETPAGWDGASRVTILVMGLDYRDWESGEGAPRTDTMILLTIDPLSRTAGMLSIPRDLYVSIPGFQYDRINTAYREGEIFQLPGGGPALAVETVEQLIGVPIDFYAQIDFNSFVRMIDEIGGLKIDIPEPIEVDPIGERPPRILPAGRTVLPGEMALAYARARGTEGGDFDRAVRQQQVIFAIRDRILSKDLIPILLTKSAVLYNELAAGVHTDLSLEQAVQLGILATQIPEENIRRGVIGAEQILFYTTPEGDQVLKPIPDKIRELRDQVFGTSNLSSPLTGLSLVEQLAAEAANVLILNGTFQEGLALDTAAYLTGLGLTIPDANASNALETVAYTTIYIYTGKPYTVKMLVEALKIQPHLIYLRYDPNSPYDIQVVLGNDWIASHTLP